jgi:hypothetical protein
MSEVNVRSEGSEVGAPVSGEPKRGPGLKVKRKYRSRAEPSSAPPSAFVQLNCERPKVPASRAPELPDPRWAAEFVAALFSGRR